ncbi:MAG: hypothetical protein VXZ83_04495 [Verrucomicrobiota bacterium]|nr:hypothetical protein [Verrucomicrobiota bacterium]
MLEIAFLVTSLIGLVLSLFWIILKSSSIKIDAQYTQLTRKLGIMLETPPPKLGGFIRSEPVACGIYRGREISFSAPGKGLQNTRQIETVLKIELRNKVFKAQFAPTGIMGSLGQRDSGKLSLWKSGDIAFDAAIDVRSNQSDYLNSLLNPEISQFLVQSLKKQNARLYIGNGTIAYTEIGLIADDITRERFERAVEILCNFAENAEL